MNMDNQWSKLEGLFCTCDSSVASCQSPVSLLVNEFDVRSVLHGQGSLAAVNHSYVFHEAMNGLQKSKDSSKACFEIVHI